MCASTFSKQTVIDSSSSSMTLTPKYPISQSSSFVVPTHSVSGSLLAQPKKVYYKGPAPIQITAEQLLAQILSTPLETERKQNSKPEKKMPRKISEEKMKERLGLPLEFGKPGKQRKNKRKKFFPY